MTMRPGSGLLLAAVLALSACGGEAAAPEVELADLETLDGVIRAERGHAVLVNFWALW
jgi:ABC-type glycerol-3-phosphate transport system substrate-binding protein